MATDLTLAGYRVREALAVSEVLYLCEQESGDLVVICAEVEDADMIQLQIWGMTVRLQPGATVKTLSGRTRSVFHQLHPHLSSAQ